MPVPPDLFIGLVTHPRSRFPEAQSDDGLGPTVVRTLRDQGRTVEWRVSAMDEWTPELLRIDRREVSASIQAEFDIEARWRSYIAGRRISIVDRLLLTARRLRRTSRLSPRSKRHMSDEDPGFRSVRRLANIELSHMRLLRDAVATNPAWALIIEDDAGAPDQAAFALQLNAFLADRTSHAQPLMMSLSESFTPVQLGIEQLLTPSRCAIPGVPWAMWEADRLVSNTVCATLYRGEFLSRLVEQLDQIPLTPVVPIDFKVNEALMRIAGTSTLGDSWIAYPAPLIQRSGVPHVLR